MATTNGAPTIIGKVSFLASNKKYVCADQGSGNELHANRDKVGPWETFTLVKFHPKGENIALISNIGHCVCAEVEQATAPINATREKLGPWETFTMQMI